MKTKKINRGIKMQEEIEIDAEIQQESEGKKLSQADLGALQSKNIRIHNRRTSVRLEPEMWNALNEIAKIEHCTIHDLCGAVNDLKEPHASFTAALRVFLMEYYRAAARAGSQVAQVQRRLKDISVRAANVTGAGKSGKAEGGNS
jgi:predicted DNA-binding ribbon-helix-helix protein